MKLAITQGALFIGTLRSTRCGSLGYVCSRALGEFIGTHAPDRVTERMNDVVRDVDIEPDAFSVAASRQILKKTEW